MCPLGNRDNSKSDSEILESLVVAVTSLASDVKQLKTEAKKAEAMPSTPYMEPEIPSISQPMVGAPVSLNGIRSCPEIAARVDNVMAQDATADLLNLHYVTGGKLLKSPRDAPTRRIMRTVLWPNQFVTRMSGATGACKYDELTVPEFMLGALKIVQLTEITEEEKKSRLEHLELIMTLARYYTWSAIRNMYGVVLEDVQYGSLNWGQSIQGYKDAHMHPGAMTQPAIGSVRDARTPKLTRPTPTTTLASTDPCRKFNYEECTRDPCPYLHICLTCRRYHSETQSHTARDCPRRAAFVAARMESPAMTSMTPPNINRP